MNIQLGSMVQICVPQEAGDVPDLVGIVEVIQPMAWEGNIGKYICTVLLNGGGREYCMLSTTIK